MILSTPVFPALALLRLPLAFSLTPPDSRRAQIVFRTQSGSALRRLFGGAVASHVCPQHQVISRPGLDWLAPHPHVLHFAPTATSSSSTRPHRARAVFLLSPRVRSGHFDVCKYTGWAPVQLRNNRRARNHWVRPRSRAPIACQCLDLHEHSGARYLCTSQSVLVIFGG